MDTPTDGWDPDQYRRFQAERRRPFVDLLALMAPVPAGSVVDLGCGSGELTAELHRATGARHTVGIDSSAAMLEEAARHAGGHVRFAAGDIGTFHEPGTRDIVFSNAALQWVPDHGAVLARWAASLRPGGQLAVQIPANAAHPSHTVAVDVAHEEPFLSALDGAPPPDPTAAVADPAWYAETLYRLGFEEQHVRLQVYGPLLPSPDGVVEWMQGTALTRFRGRLAADLYERFVARYRSRLLDVLGDQRPYFYAFPRILFWARRPGADAGRVKT